MCIIKVVTKATNVPTLSNAGIKCANSKSVAPAIDSVKITFKKTFSGCFTSISLSTFENTTGTTIG
jgi:hypothetical protein